MAQEEQAPLVADSPANDGPKVKKARPAKVLPTDRIAFPRQLDLLRAYAIASGPTGKAVSLNDVASVMKLTASTISLANPFFTDIGLIARIEGGFVPAAEVISFNRAF